MSGANREGEEALCDLAGCVYVLQLLQDIAMEKCCQGVCLFVFISVRPVPVFLSAGEDIYLTVCLVFCVCACLFESLSTGAVFRELYSGVDWHQ